MTERERKEIFASWLKEKQALLFKVVRAYAFNPFDHDDLFQEIALQIWRSIPNFKQQAAVSTWLYRISLNTAIKWNRRRRKHVQGRQSIHDLPHVLEEQEKFSDERLTWLYEEIANFNEIDRSLILLLLDGFSYRDMSQILGITESNVGVKINRIKKQLIVKSKNYDYHGV